MHLSNVIDRFAKEHHDHTCKAGKGGSIILSDVPPAPPLDPKEDHPAIDYWFKEDFTSAEANRLAGETNGDAPTDNPAPPKKGKYSAHYYLQHHDGTQVSKKQVAALSFDARKLWIALKDEGRAPKTFSKMSSSAWEFFSHMLLSDPDHAFLRLCDDGEWKLREWATQNYSSWTLNIGLREKKKKGQPQQKAKSENNILDDPKLLRMQDEDGDGDEGQDEDGAEGDDDGDEEDDDDDPFKNINNHDGVPDESAQGVDSGKSMDKGKSTDKGNPPPQMQPVRQSTFKAQAQLTSNDVEAPRPRARPVSLFKDPL